MLVLSRKLGEKIIIGENIVRNRQGQILDHVARSAADVELR